MVGTSKTDDGRSRASTDAQPALSKVDGRLALIKKLGEMTSEISVISDLETLASVMERLMDEIVSVEHDGIYLVDLKSNKLKLYRAKGFTEEERAEAERTAMERHPAKVFQTGKMLHVPDVENDTHRSTADSKRSFAIRSRLYIPILSGDERVGAFGLGSSKPHAFTDEHVAMLQFVCNLAGVIYKILKDSSELTRRQKEMLGRNRELNFINRIVSASNLQKDVGGFLRIVLDSALELMRFNAGGIYLIDPGTNAAELRHHVGLTDQLAQDAACVPPDSPLFSEVLGKGRALFREKYKASSKMPGLADARSLAAVPILAGDKVIGAVAIGSRKAHVFRREEKEALSAIGRQVGTVLSRMLAEQGLSASEEEYRRLFENVDIGVYRSTIEAPGRFLRVNPALARILGYDSVEEVLALPSSSLYINPEDRNTSGKQVIKWGFASNIELLMKKKDGTPIWTSCTSRAVSDATGRVRWFDGFIHDITRHREAREQILRRDSILQAVSFAAQRFLELRDWRIGIYDVLERLGVALQVSRSYIFQKRRDASGVMLASQMFEWSAPGIQSQTANPELIDVPIEAAGFGRWLKAFEQGQAIAGPIKDFPENEQPILMAQDIKSIVMVPIFSDEGLWGFIGFDECENEREWSPVEIETLKTAASTLGAAIEHDRMEGALRSSEENYRTLLENVDIGVFRTSFDPPGAFVHANPALARMLGYDSIADLMRVPVSAVYQDPQQRLDYLDEMSKCGYVSNRELRLKKKDGTPVYALCSSGIQRDEKTGVAWLDGFLQDITARKKAEKDKEILEEQLRQAVKMEAVGRLAGGVAHDFNNLLTAIVGYSDILLSSLHASDPIRPDIDEIKKAAERAGQLTQQLLAFGRKQIISPQAMDLNALVENSRKLLGRIIREDVELRFIPGDTLWPVKADPGQIEQALFNLAVNARDAMPEGGILTVETRNLTLDAEYDRFHALMDPGDYVIL